MSTVIVIPARFASTRYPGKPLVGLRGPDGVTKTLIQRSWETAMAASGIAEVHVATDDDRIRAAAEGFGASVIMTSPEAENGTMRCAEAMANAGIEADLVINLQGDAPLTPPWFVEALAEAMETSPAQCATPVVRCDAETASHFREDRRHGRVGGTTAVFDANMRALYFSKEVIPFTPEGAQTPIPVFHHVGIYAYRPAALAAYQGWKMGPLERNEGLEQLRFLENGMEMACVEVDGRGRVFWELNNPVDVARIEGVLAKL